MKHPTVSIFHSLSDHIAAGTACTPPGCNTAQWCPSEPSCHPILSIPVFFLESWVRWEGFSLADWYIFTSTLSQPEKSGARLRISDPSTVKLACELALLSESAWCSPAHAKGASMANPYVAGFRLLGINLLPPYNLCCCWVQSSWKDPLLNKTHTGPVRM